MTALPQPAKNYPVLWRSRILVETSPVIFKKRKLPYIFFYYWHMWLLSAGGGVFKCSSGSWISGSSSLIRGHLNSWPTFKKLKRPGPLLVPYRAPTLGHFATLLASFASTGNDYVDINYCVLLHSFLSWWAFLIITNSWNC